MSAFASQSRHLFVGASGSAADAPLSSHARPETSGSALLDRPCRNWSPETVHTESTHSTDDVKSTFMDSGTK